MGPAVQQVLDAITDAPAWVRNGRHDIVAMNRLGRALYARSWPTRAGRRTPPGSSTSTRPRPSELSTQSEIFRKRWASHDVQFHRSGHKRLRHPVVVGRLDLNFESMELPSEPGLTLNVYTATPNTPTADALTAGVEVDLPSGSPAG